jgi:hypothetical protein
MTIGKSEHKESGCSRGKNKKISYVSMHSKRGGNILKKERRYQLDKNQGKICNIGDNSSKETTLRVSYYDPPPLSQQLGWASGCPLP